MTPVRIQRKRTKGWRMPENTVYVGRPGKWGNPYAVGDESAWMGEWPVLNIEDPLTRGDAAQLFHLALAGGHLDITADQIRAELAGKNLACWCPEDQPCHADVLLAVANEVVHAYAAAGFVVCGLETGGAISRHDGYTGPRLRTTADDIKVTCPGCAAKLKDNHDG